MDDYIGSARNARQPLPAKGFEDNGADVSFSGGQSYTNDAQAAEDIDSIFSIGRVQASPTSVTAHCKSLTPRDTAASNTIPPRLIRIDLSKPDEDETIDIPLPASTAAQGKRQSQAHDVTLPTIQRLFVDPTGKHVVITATSGEVFYVYDGWAREQNTRRKRMRPLGKLKGLQIESIAWNSGISPASGGSTREILFGTRNGRIFETCIDGELESSRPFGRTAHERYLRQILQVQQQQPILGLHFELWQNRPNSRRRAVMIATTSTRIYQYVGSVAASNTSNDSSESLFESLGAAYRDKETTAKQLELPGEIPYSELHVWQVARGGPSTLTPPKTIAWLTGPGIYHGQLTYSSQEPGDGVIDAAQLLPYPARPSSPNPFDISPGREHVIHEVPLSMALTEYHFILLYHDCVRIIRILDDTLVFEEPLDLPPGEKVLALVADPFRHTYWFYSASSIFELSVRDEDRDVWSVYLERNAFDSALKFAKTPQQRDQILTKRAESLFGQSHYVQAAELYAQTSKSFEEVVLRFIDLDERDALRNYLHNRLSRLRKTELTQRLMLATWLLQLFLAKLDDLDDRAASELASEDASNMRLEQEILEEDFRDFLRTYKENLDRRTVFNLLKNSGRRDLGLYFAEVVGDHEHILSHWIFEENWLKAIDTLNRQTDLDLYYRFAPTLLHHCPGPSVDALSRQVALEPRRLIPALLQPRSLSADATKHFVQYLQTAIFKYGNKDPAVHNALINLLATSVSPDEEELIRYLSVCEEDTETGRPCYDLDYALRLCKANGRLQACVHIYSKMGLYASSVDLALQSGDVELAKINADKPEDDDQLRRRLWLRVAQHVVGDKHDIKAAMRFLESTDLLKIEDILPFFPDFVVIDDFKDEICNALEGYAAQIDQLKVDMDDANRSAQAIKEDIAKLSSRFVVVDATEKCVTCGLPLLTRQFYVFPCLHSFHADCLINEVTQHLSPRVLRRILDLQSQLSRDVLRTADEAVLGIAKSETPSGLLEPGTRAKLAAALAGPAVASVQSLAVAGQGLDQLRKLVIPDALVSVIGGGILSTKRQDRTKLASEAVRRSGAAKATKMDRLRQELDDLLASSCVLCDLSINSLDLPFIAEGEKEL